jgi:hypothetical protein
MVSCRTACHAIAGSAAYGRAPFTSASRRSGSGTALLLPRSIKPGATIASSAPRPLSLRLKLLAICEKLHNLGIYSYGSGERFFMLRKPDDNTLSITRVRASRALSASGIHNDKEILSALAMVLTSLRAGHPSCQSTCRRPIHDGSTIGPWHGIHLFRPACPT